MVNHPHTEAPCGVRTIFKGRAPGQAAVGALHFPKNEFLERFHVKGTGGGGGVGISLVTQLTQRAAALSAAW